MRSAMACRGGVPLTPGDAADQLGSRAPGQLEARRRRLCGGQIGVFVAWANRIHCSPEAAEYPSWKIR